MGLFKKKTAVKDGKGAEQPHGYPGGPHPGMYHKPPPPGMYAHPPPGYLVPGGMPYGPGMPRPPGDANYWQQPPPPQAHAPHPAYASSPGLYGAPPRPPHQMMGGPGMPVEGSHRRDAHSMHAMGGHPRGISAPPAPRSAPSTPRGTSGLSTSSLALEDSKPKAPGMVENLIIGATVLRVFDGDNIQIKEFPESLPPDIYNLVQARQMQMRQGLHSEAEKMLKKLHCQNYFIDEEHRKVFHKRKIRLRGTIAPLAGQKHQLESVSWLDKRLAGKLVNVFAYETDKHGRIVADVCTQSDNILIQMEMLRSGYAWHYSLQDKRPEFADFEQEARDAKKGLWALEEDPLPPWKFRKQQRDLRSPENSAE